jgi:hypothetical protein
MEFALSACVLAVRLGDMCGYSQEALRILRGDYRPRGGVFA